MSKVINNIIHHTLLLFDILNDDIYNRKIITSQKNMSEPIKLIKNKNIKTYKHKKNVKGSSGAKNCCMS